MAFVIDKEQIKPGLIISRRGDVMHRNFYCRVKLPKEDRYKTVALGTTDRESARDITRDKLLRGHLRRQQEKISSLIMESVPYRDGRHER